MSICKCTLRFIILEKIKVFLIITVEGGCIWIELGVLTVSVAIWRRFGYLSQGFLIQMTGIPYQWQILAANLGNFLCFMHLHRHYVDANA